MSLTSLGGGEGGLPELNIGHGEVWCQALVSSTSVWPLSRQRQSDLSSFASSAGLPSPSQAMQMAKSLIGLDHSVLSVSP